MWHLTWMCLCISRNRRYTHQTIHVNTIFSINHLWLEIKRYFHTPFYCTLSFSSSFPFVSVPEMFNKNMENKFPSSNPFTPNVSISTSPPALLLMHVWTEWGVHHPTLALHQIMGHLIFPVSAVTGNPRAASWTCRRIDAPCSANDSIYIYIHIYIFDYGGTLLAVIYCVSLYWPLYHTNVLFFTNQSCSFYLCDNS